MSFLSGLSLSLSLSSLASIAWLTAFFFLFFFFLRLFIIGFDDTRDNKKEKVIKIFIVVFIRWMGADECALCGEQGEQCQRKHIGKR